MVQRSTLTFDHSSLFIRCHFSLLRKGVNRTLPQLQHQHRTTPFFCMMARGTGISSLFVELWMAIASYLSNQDLAHLTYTSVHLLDIIRPLLYRSVELDAFNATEPLALLARDATLAKCVIMLTLQRTPDSYSSGGSDDDEESEPENSPPSSDLPSLINLDALANLTSLRHILLYGAIFRNALEQNEFGKALSVGIPLQQLAMI